MILWDLIFSSHEHIVKIKPFFPDQHFSIHLKILFVCLKKKNREIEKIVFKWVRQETDHTTLISLFWLPVRLLYKHFRKNIDFALLKDRFEAFWSFPTRSFRLGSSEIINSCPITLIFSLSLRKEITDAAHFSNFDSINS